tara:strand:- start:410 stop:862 length:453 start_codon:yes stop_codon:yes gene_type:complete
MVTVELLYRPNWNIDLFFKKFKVKRSSNGCLGDYVDNAVNKKIKQKYPYFIQRSAKSLFQRTAYSNEKKEIEEDIRNRMNLLITFNGLHRMRDDWNDMNILVNFPSSTSSYNGLENKVKTLSSQFKKNFDVRLMGEIKSLPNKYVEGYGI